MIYPEMSSLVEQTGHGAAAEFTIKDIVHMTSFSDGYVRKILTELKLRKMVERIGSKKTGYWKVKTL